MSYEIIGETIKSATSIKIGEIFKTSSIVDGKVVYTYPTRYKENITKPKYPNFSINQININITPKGRTRMQLDYLITIQYRIAENTETISNLQQQLDNIGLRLCTELTELELERPTKTYNRYYEKVDGVLHMFFNITIFAIPEEEDGPDMEHLELEEEVI